MGMTGSRPKRTVADYLIPLTERVCFFKYRTAAFYTKESLTGSFMNAKRNAKLTPMADSTRVEQLHRQAVPTVTLFNEEHRRCIPQWGDYGADYCLQFCCICL